MNRRVQAKTLSTERVLRAVDDSCLTGHGGKHASTATIGEVARRFPAAPEKVVLAKLSRLLDKGLITGCACGCFGDFQLTPDGVALLGGRRSYSPLTTAERVERRARSLDHYFALRPPSETCC